nr:MAG TPA: hypothetical protein [Microviridae sp.]
MVGFFVFIWNTFGFVHGIGLAQAYLSILRQLTPLFRF